MKCSRVLFDFVCWLAVVGSASGSGLYGRVQNLSFVPDAGTKPQDKHEIPEPALFQFLLDEEIINHPDVDVNYLDDWESNALDYAKGNKHGHGERIANLLKAKGAVKREDKPDAMARVLDRAVKDSNEELIRALIKNGLKISTEKWGERMNLLHSASFHAKTTDLIDVLLETGEFDINGGDNDGNTPLHYAVAGLDPKRNVAHLIQLGADPNVADKNGVTALTMAAKNAESMHLIELLLLNREAVGVGYCDKQEYYFYR
ncbi:hypothetical protein DAPPUDRAFT_331336 [Daphnia pulex]|uniref:Uncharacterized protein n=1 Tax=Daphnia pulex TaxID=6669 RepID=E9HM66_DAPPU|nr:hypothetical protein DAPPUDRAFT_331336 [Daphnia pulex]|eukprot:EFX67179.1 hypothetical protein DAPPUDRAFT_331336 [Daphnia pulex]